MVPLLYLTYYRYQHMKLGVPLASFAFDRDVIRAVKEAAVFDKPFVKKSALIGTEDLPASFYDELKSFSRRDMMIFKTREEALAWLVADSVDS